MGVADDMTTIKTLSDLVSWLETWERDRAAGLVPASEVAHRALVIDLLKPFAAEEGSAVLAERERVAAMLESFPVYVPGSAIEAIRSGEG